jgi:hypothetical protein
VVTRLKNEDMKPWKARKYVEGKPVATKMFRTEQEAIDFVDEQNTRTLGGIHGAFIWRVQKTFDKHRL